MNFSQKITVNIKGKPHRLQAEVYSRGGSKSPQSVYFWYNGKRLTPWQQRRMGFEWTLQTMLSLYLPDHLLREELVKRDWLLRDVEKNNAWLGGDLIVPFRSTSL